MQIFHIAERSRWEAARLAGAYAQSTRGRTLEEVGFIHAAREDQWQEVRRQVYAEGTEPLVLLVIDTDKLTAPWQEDTVGDTTYPHVYGPLNPSAVIRVEQLDPADRPDGSFARAFYGEMAFRMLVATAVMALAVICGVAGTALAGDVGGLVGILAGLAGGAAAAVALNRRRQTAAAANP